MIPIYIYKPNSKPKYNYLFKLCTCINIYTFSIQGEALKIQVVEPCLLIN